MKYLTLSKTNYLGKGRERACYIHPLDNKKVVKIVYNTKEKLNQNQLEYEYLTFLEKKNKSFTHLSRCFGRVKTNLGEGYIFERIVDYNGEASKSFKYMVMNGLLNKNVEEKLLEELKVYLLENNIIFVDVAFSNIQCQKISKNDYKLVLTDGIGGKRVGLKSKIYLYSKLFTKYKVKKQLKKIDSRYKKVIKDGVKLNKRLIGE